MSILRILQDAISTSVHAYWNWLKILCCRNVQSSNASNHSQRFHTSRVWEECCCVRTPDLGEHGSRTKCLWTRVHCSGTTGTFWTLRYLIPPSLPTHQVHAVSLALSSHYLSIFTYLLDNKNYNSILSELIKLSIHSWLYLLIYCSIPC
jgi:hypothetical protein